MQLFKSLSGTPEKIAPAGKFLSYQEMRDYVGGDIEQVWGEDGTLFILNEEGKLHYLPFNNEASCLAWKLGAIFADDYLAGDVVVLTPWEAQALLDSDFEDEEVEEDS